MAVALADIHVKVDPQIKEASETVLGKIGITMSDLVNMTLRRVVYERRVPFDTEVPTTVLPKSMTISSKEEFISYIDNALDKNSRGKEYTLAEVDNMLDRAIAEATA